MKILEKISDFIEDLLGPDDADSVSLKHVIALLIFFTYLTLYILHKMPDIQICLRGASLLGCQTVMDVINKLKK
jgi:hypothetical protein